MIEKKSKTDVVDQNSKAAGLNRQIEEVLHQVRSIASHSELQELRDESSRATRQKEILTILTEYRSYVDLGRVINARERTSWWPRQP